MNNWGKFGRIARIFDLYRGRPRIPAKDVIKLFRKIEPSSPPTFWRAGSVDMAGSGNPGRHGLLAAFLRSDSCDPCLAEKEVSRVYKDAV